MVAERLEDEVIEILKLIDEKKNFLLEGGAGSGKTYSLVSLINEIYRRNSKVKIACITYTNAAVHEIENRVSNKKLKICTIHDFLWENISSFQKELKETLLEGINTQEIYKNIKVEIPYENKFADNINYKEHLRISEGVISHDEVIILANQMFKKYHKLRRILNNKYDFILVDEYQDTFSQVVEILLDFLPQCDISSKSIVGFFGDSMQSIYDSGVGDLQKYVDKKILKKITKEQNRRNPQLIIDLGNKLRIDGLVQKASLDKNAPNMINGKIKKGDIKFLYGKNMPFNDIKQLQYFKNWDFSNPKETKELRLTHNLIAETAGFFGLMEIYDKDPILKLKKDFLNHIKNEKISINESLTFDDVLRSVNWKKKTQKDRQYLDIFLENEINRKCYDLVKDKLFLDVIKIYFDKDNLISDKKEIDEEKSTSSKRDKLIRHLFKIQSVIQMYKNKNYNDFLRKTSFLLNKAENKKLIKEKIDILINMKDNSISDIIEYANYSGICIKDDNIINFIKENEYLYKRVSKIKYYEFINLYEYLEGFSPLSTQHKIKGEEFKNILVILDNGKWNNYNFEYLFNQKQSKSENVLNRTRKLFYVCCTRAMENLAVYCNNPSNEMIKTAEEWFGKENCCQINKE